MPNHHSNLNSELFFVINSFGDIDVISDLSILFTKLGSFSLHVLFVLFFFILMIVMRNKNYFLEAFLTFSISLFTCSFILMLMKDYFLIPRPYCIYSEQEINIVKHLMNPEKCLHSFPSGHTTRIVGLTVSIWSLLSKNFKILMVLISILVPLSRIFVGAHYPLDLIGGYLIGLIVTLVIKHNIIILLENDKIRKILKNTGLLK